MGTQKKGTRTFNEAYACMQVLIKKARIHTKRHMQEVCNKKKGTRTYKETQVGSMQVERKKDVHRNRSIGRQYVGRKEKDVHRNRSINSQKRVAYKVDEIIECRAKAFLDPGNQN